jgi:hypothetical protein
MNEIRLLEGLADVPVPQFLSTSILNRFFKPDISKNGSQNRLSIPVS